MEPSTSSFVRLYDFAQEQFMRGATADARTTEEATTERLHTTRQQQDPYESKFNRLVEEACHRGRRGDAQQTNPEKLGGGAAPPGTAPVARRNGVRNGCVRAGDDTGVEGQKGGGQADDCLGLMAEAFADDLDLLRKDENFRGSETNVAAMADMMRCLASGLNSTEQKMLLENATR